MTAGPAQRWQLVTPPPELVKDLVARLSLSPLLARLLVNRGLSSPELAQAFLEPKLSALPDPDLMAGSQRAAERLAAAVVGGEKIWIYGDYDVDGVTSSALLFRFLALVGVNAEVFLPDRFSDGYGLNSARLAEICDRGAQLIIAADCGTTAVAAIEAVGLRGVDLIVCDHHAPGPVLPPAYALMSPHAPGGHWPDAHPSAVGVALLLAQSTRRALHARGWFSARPAPSLGALLQYAALGTIADMVQLRGFNRIVSALGLRQLGRSQLPGVVAMKARANLRRVASADHVGFVLGPRINAAGRVADARTAFSLLTTARQDEAAELADRIEVENNRRKEIQASVATAAVSAAEQQPGREHAIVVADAGWHAGVVGIVASRLKDHFGVPAFVLSLADGKAVGSGRSIHGYDLVAGLRAVAGEPRSDGLLRRYGGHYFAAGVTLAADRVDTFRDALVEHVARTLPPAKRRNDLRIDAELSVTELELGLLQDLDRLEPYGKGNARPTFLLRGVVIAKLLRVGQRQEWARMRLVETSDRPLWGRRGVNAFGSALPLVAYSDGDVVDVVCKLERNNHRGEVSLQATVVALARAGQPVQTLAPAPTADT